MTALLLAAALGACSPDLPDPLLSGVTPAWGFNGEETRITLTGAGFFPRVEVGGPEGGSVDDRFELWLQGDSETPLSDVELLDYEHLAATVPVGLPVGLYDLRVVTPAGAESSLAEAFEVRDSRADTLVATTVDDQVSFQVYDYAAITVALVDPDGAPVQEDLLIEVSLDAEVLGTTLFQEDTLADQAPLDDGSGIQGRLGPDGVGVVALTSTVVTEELLVRFTVPEGDVGGTVQFLSFVAGDPAGVRLDLPSEAFVATAGEPFDVDLVAVDEDGNPVEDAQAELALWEACPGGSFRDTVSFVGQKKLAVTFTRATGEDCAASALQALGFVDGQTVDTASAPFEVRAASAEGLDLEVWPEVVVAGEEEIFAWIRAVDAWDNVDTARSGSVQVLVTVDGLPPATPAAVTCDDMVDGEAWCRVRVDSAGEQVVLLATIAGPDPLTGASPPVQVLPGTPVSMDLVVATDPAVAGESYPAYLALADALGNLVPFDPLGSGAPQLRDDVGDSACAWSGEGEPAGTQRYACVATRAGEDRRLSASSEGLGLSDESAPFDVVNGALAEVTIALGDTGPLVAGEGLAVELSAADAWGNAYRVQDDPVLDLADLSGPVVPAEARLDAEGTARLTVVLTVARDDDQVVASQGGVELGRSVPLDVVAAEPSTLDLVAARGWLALGETLPVEIRAQDRFGNTDLDYAGPVDLGSDLGLVDPVTAEDFVDGTATVALDPVRAGLGDRLWATDGTLDGELDLDVVDLACPDGPTADLALDGSEDLVLCLLEALGRTRSVVVDAGASVAGGAPLAAWYLDDGDGWAALDGTSTTRTWAAAGGVRLELLVADAEACADLAQARAWVGEDDGAATGPVELLADAPTVSTLGDGLPDGSALALEARTCTGDAAAGATLQVRADRGAFEVDGTTLAATGAGLQVVLDGHGRASVDWSVAGTGAAGTATLLAGHPSGQAWGATTVEVQDDLVLPRVLDLDPRGSTSAGFSSIEIQFTEALLASSVQPTAISLFEPGGAAWPLAAEDLALSSDGTRVLVQLGEAVSGAEGTWTLALAGSREAGVRDLEGNVLDGGWTGVRGPFTVDFGAVPDLAPEVLDCGADLDSFRPDGDDGGGEEADVVQLVAAADAVPAWWRREITDAAGAVVRTDWIPGDGSTGLLTTWDGRGDDGAVLGHDVYTLALQAADATWNLSSACAAQVTLDHRIPSP